MMATVSERLNVRLVTSRMIAFVDKFSKTKSSSESAERMRKKQGLDLDLRLEILVMIGACLSRSEDRVLLYAVNRQSRESGGFLIS